MPANADEKQGGRFQPGQSGNPAGKAAGTRHRTTLAMETLLDGEGEKLARVAIDKALEGDLIALRLCLDRLMPPRKDVPVKIELPPVRTIAEAVEASVAVLAAVGAGEVTPDEGGRVMALLTAHRAIVEAGDLEARIAALEAKEATK
jgi:hypothetical protein